MMWLIVELPWATTNAVEDRCWWEKSVWLVNCRPWSWGYRQFEMELVSLHFMLTRNSQKEVVVRTLLKEALNSNFWLMWEQCLDKGMVPVWDQLVLQAGALQGNSHLAGEACWTQLNRFSRMHKKPKRNTNSRERIKVGRGNLQNQYHAFWTHVQWWL